MRLFKKAEPPNLLVVTLRFWMLGGVVLATPSNIVQNCREPLREEAVVLHCWHIHKEQFGSFLQLTITEITQKTWIRKQQNTFKLCVKRSMSFSCQVWEKGVLSTATLLLSGYKCWLVFKISMTFAYICSTTVFFLVCYLKVFVGWAHRFVDVRGDGWPWWKIQHF